MKIWPNDVAKHLKDNGLPLVSCFYGEEPLLSIESVDQCLAWAKQSEMQIARFTLDAHTDWSSIQAELGGMSLFGEATLVFLQQPFEAKLPDKFATQIESILNLVTEGSHLLIQVGALTKKQQSTKWFSRVQESGVVCLCKTPKDNALTRWIKQRMDQAKIQYDDRVLDYLAYRCNGNLLAAKQEIDILKLAYDSLADKNPLLTMEMTRQISSDHARFSFMDLKDACLLGQYPQALNIFYHLQEQSKATDAVPLAIILQNEIKRLVDIQQSVDAGLSLAAALKKAWVLSFLENQYKTAFTHINKTKLRQLTWLANETEKAAKGASIHRAWQQLAMLVAVFASHKSPDELLAFTALAAHNDTHVVT